ncbi:MAG: imidazolonepropionase [Candidatus Cloacimonetes bacterium]|nr:imidazolonepropionase [Candidatus Cloacimonadota bacterium]
MKADLIIKNAKELLTLQSDGPKCGLEMQNLGIIQNGAIAILEEEIAGVGTTKEVSQNFISENVIDATGKVVMPGFVDPHTHPIFVETRENEFEMRIQGKSYKEISQSGGGIRSSVSDVRKASKEELVALGLKRVNKMLEMGATTIEAKSGYGLSTESEIKMLEAIAEINEISEMDIIPTFLGAHEFPEEYKNNKEEYIKILIDEMLPEVKKQNLAKYCDIFCEKHVFDIEQSRRILSEAKKLGFKIRMHADELEPIGGAELAAEIGAVTADHLVAVSDNGIQKMKEANVIPIMLPATTFSLGLKKYAPARKMIDAGLPVVLATDFNPGSCHCDSMQTIISIACLEMGLLPSEAITASTINAAYSLELGNTIGSIEIGKQADILIMDMPSYKYLPYHLGSSCVDMVIKKGEVVFNNSQE